MVQAAVHVMGVPTAVPDPTFEAVQNVAEGVENALGLTPCTVPAVAVAAVPFCFWVIVQATLQYTVADSSVIVL